LDGGGPAAPLVVRASQRTTAGWTAFGGPFPVASPLHALSSDPVHRTAVVAVPGSDPATVDVRALPSGAPICAPTFGERRGFAPADGIGIAPHPSGGFVVAAQDDGTRIVVQRLQP